MFTTVPLRHTTPPTYSHPAYYGHGMPHHFSHPAFFSSNENSPDSVATNDTSPQRSPRTNFRNGPPLLPKIRCQDQTEPMSTAGPINTSRAVSHPVPTISTNFQGPPHFYRRATSPPEGFDINSPVSAISLPASVFSHGLSSHSGLSAITAPLSAAGTPSSAHPLSSSRMGSTPPPMSANLASPIANMNHPNPSSRRSSLALVRTVSQPIPSSQNHSRSASQSSIDEAALLKHGYPTQYRKMPQYISAAPQMSNITAATVHSMPLQAQDSYDMLLQDNSFLRSNLELGQMIPPVLKSNTTLMSYLTSTCPTPSLITRSMTDTQRHWDYGWWDIRNLRSWTNFNINAILSVPEFSSLLNFAFDADTLPHPQPSNSAPETEYVLRDMYRDHFATKINAALEMTQGSKHLNLRPANSATIQHYPKPDFISSYDHDMLTTHRGEQRGHLVGIVKAYEEWNTGMRTQTPPQQVKYLRGLAQLHRVMREHRCRYGFIITEIEILCVRAGAEDSAYLAHKAAHVQSMHANPEHDEGPKPIFGLLELAAPISLSTSGPNPSTGAPRMTPALALWFLHMLAKNEPLPGYPPWKMGVGGPAALTRQNHRPRDSWMPKIVVSETRAAKRLRGWVYPNEPLNRREMPNVRRRR